MTVALATLAEAGTLVVVFALGVLWERHRHPPPPSVHRVIVSVEGPEGPEAPTTGPDPWPSKR
jgi:hypothetical protein